MTIVELIRTFNWSRFYEVLAKRVAWVNHLPGIWYTSFLGDFGLTDLALGDEVAYYPMDDITDTDKVIDTSGSENHATRVGFGPVARYSFDADSIVDDSGNGNDGTGATDITYEDSDYGRAAVFNGTTSHFDLPAGALAPFNPANSFSASCRVKLATLTPAEASGRLFEIQGAGSIYTARIYFDSVNDKFHANVSDGVDFVISIGANGSATTEYVDLVLTWDALTTTIILYIDGDAQTPGVNALVGAHVPTQGYVGGVGTSTNLDASIDELRFFDYCLTPESALALHNRPTAPAEVVAGVAGNAISFTGARSVNTLTIDATAWPGISVSMWLKKADSVNQGMPFEFGAYESNGVYLFCSADGTGFRWIFSEAGLSESEDTGDLTVGEWGHIVMCYDHATAAVRTYLNGVNIIDTVLVNGPIVMPNKVLTLGNYNSANGTVWDWFGLIDEVHIFNRALTQAEVTDLNQLSNHTFWIPDPATLAVNFIKSVLIDYDTPLPPVASIAALSAEPSFYWDNDNKLLYIRLEDFDPPGLHNVSPGLIQGFSNRGVVYVDDLYYAPLLISAPRLGIQQDLQGETKLTFFTGNVELSNTGGDLDELKDDPVYGNDLFIAHLDDDDVDAEGVATRTDLQYLASLYVEDYGIGLQRMVLRVKDRRAAQNIEILIDRFSADDYPDINETYIGQVIPLLYGQVREIPAIPLSDPAGAGAVDYRVASVMTVLGSVYTLQAEVWTSVAPTESDVATGTFTLAEIDGRNAAGGLFDCKVVDPVGVPVTYASDVIKDLFDRMLGVTYNSSNYDTTEWEAEETGLTTVGLAITKPTKLYDVIGDLSAGANVVVRFEFLPTGERTIRLDDWSRAVSLHVPVVDILKATAIEVDTDTDLLAATVVVEYARSYVTDVMLRHEDTSQQETVLNKYRQQPTLTTPTHLINSTHAALRADYDIERFTDVHGLVVLDLMGAQYLALRIYDVLTVELGYGEFDLDLGTFTGDREFYGIQKAQVIGVDPDFEAETNKVRVVLIGEYSYDVRVTTDGDLRVTTDGEVRRLL